jgi:urocanate reductase
MSVNHKEPLSRREFIKGAAVAGAAVATAGVLGVSPAHAAAGVPDKWDQETDVLVVGSGYAGLCAAIEAADAGAKVLIIEKGALPGGNSILCAGNALFCATHIQKALGVEDKPEWFYEDQMIYGEHRAVPELLRTFVNNSADTVLWLEKLGLKFRGTLGTSEGNRVPRGHGADPSPNYFGSSGMGYWSCLNVNAEKRGVKTLLKHKMTRLIRPDNQGPVLGAEVENEGKKLYFRARRAVVLASGGWKSNVYMRMAWDPRLDADLSAGGLPYVDTTGDGINAAVDIGATVTDMSFVCEFRFKWGTKVYQLWEPAGLTTQPATGTGLAISDFQQVIFVKNDGKRFVSEEAAKTYPQIEFYEAYLNMTERPRAVWAIADSAGVAVLKWNPEQFKNPQPLKPPALTPETVAVADTIEELAKKINVPAANLAETIKKYNGFVDAGKDADFGKPKPTVKIAKGPFYAAKLQFFAHDQQGALRANSKGQVIDRSEQVVNKVIPIDQQKVIPNLYAAGEVVGGYVGAERGHGKISIYMVFGRIAGKNAAAEKPLA